MSIDTPFLALRFLRYCCCQNVKTFRCRAESKRTSSASVTPGQVTQGIGREGFYRAGTAVGSGRTSACPPRCDFALQEWHIGSSSSTAVPNQRVRQPLGRLEGLNIASSISSVRRVAGHPWITSGGASPRARSGLVDGGLPVKELGSAGLILPSKAREPGVQKIGPSYDKEYAVGTSRYHPTTQWRPEPYWPDDEITVSPTENPESSMR